MKKTPALSIRQPWAWLIVHGPKRVENRTWETHYRGPIYIHASKSMRMKEYRFAADFAAQRNIAVPHPSHLDRGGIIGQAVLTDCARFVYGPWFAGPVGWVLDNVESVEFTPCAGQLGLFIPEVYA